jgi:hypothetical protein
VLEFAFDHDLDDRYGKVCELIIILYPLSEDPFANAGALWIGKDRPMGEDKEYRHGSLFQFDLIHQ